MKKIFWILPVAIFMLSCGGEDVKMPWEDDLGKEENKPTPTPDPENPSAGVEVGQTLPLWSEGELDIHTISTGRGECLFFVMPDGTTMVVDAGEFSRETSEYKNVLQRPNASVRPTKIFADYIYHFMPKVLNFIVYIFYYISY